MRQVRIPGFFLLAPPLAKLPVGVDPVGPGYEKPGDDRRESHHLDARWRRFGARVGHVQRREHDDVRPERRPPDPVPRARHRGIDPDARDEHRALDHDDYRRVIPEAHATLWT